MRTWKAVAGILFTAGVLSLAACRKEEEAPKPPPPDALTACRNDCKTSSETMFKECSDKMASEQAFDRMSECNTKADDYSKQCRAECDQKAGTGAATQG